MNDKATNDKRPLLLVVHRHEDLLGLERWPDVSRAEWMRIRAQLIEEASAHGF